MHYLYKVKSKVPHQTATVGPVRYVDGVSMWTDAVKAKAAIGCGSAERVNGGPCDPYLAVMEIDAPPGIVPTREDTAMALTGNWTPPDFLRVQPVEYTPGYQAKQKTAPKPTGKRKSTNKPTTEYDYGSIGE